MNNQGNNQVSAPFIVRKKIQEILLSWLLSWQQKESWIEEIRETSTENVSSFPVLQAIHKYIDGKLRVRESRHFVGAGCTERNDSRVNDYSEPSTDRGRRRPPNHNRYLRQRKIERARRMV